MRIKYDNAKGSSLQMIKHYTEGHSHRRGGDVVILGLGQIGRAEA